MPMTSDITRVAFAATPITGVLPDLRDLRAVVLLGGSIRPTDLSRAIERSSLDLPIDDRGTILDQWAAARDAVARAFGLSSLAGRVVLNREAIEPRSGGPDGPEPRLVIEREPAEFRGSGGVLRDLTVGYGADDLILVANAAQVLLEPVVPVLAELASIEGDVRILAHRDGTPASVMLIRCGVLASLGTMGYMDLKEQALPKLASSKAAVRVVMRDRPIGLPVRTVESYLEALLALHRTRAGRAVVADPLDENWASTLAVVEPGATVDPTARLQDSVVLSGGVVEAGAVCARCVVGPGGVVKARSAAVDTIVGRNTERGGGGR